MPVYFWMTFFKGEQVNDRKYHHTHSFFHFFRFFFGCLNRHFFGSNTFVHILMLDPKTERKFWPSRVTRPQPRHRKKNNCLPPHIFVKSSTLQSFSLILTCHHVTHSAVAGFSYFFQNLTNRCAQIKMKLSSWTDTTRDVCV